MQNYLFETHMHTRQSSPCGMVDAGLAVQKYYYGEYDGIIVTDHMRCDVLNSYGGTWQNRVDKFLEGYHIAKNQGDKIGLSVILGMEITFDNALLDYLVYGIDEDFLYLNENLPSMQPEEFRNLAKSSGLIMVAAHPFRFGTPPAVDMIDGVEVFNGDPRSDSKNHLAEKWCSDNRLFPMAGSDFHRDGDIVAGIYINSRPADSMEFAEILKSSRVGCIMGAKLDMHDFNYAVSW